MTRGSLRRLAVAAGWTLAVTIGIVAARVGTARAADTVELKDGQRLEGTIIAEDDNKVTLQLRESGITITQEIPRSRIARLERAADRGKALGDRGGRIDAARTVEELQHLGLEYYREHNYSIAARCIDKAIEIRPELLTTPQTFLPTSWRAFWHDRLLTLREQKLRLDDARGRVELAEWAHDVGLVQRARRLVLAALDMEPSLPRALELARQWNVYISEPLRFDLRYGLNDFLLLTTFPDESISLRPRSGNVLVLVPFAYRPRGSVEVIQRSRLSVLCEPDTGAVAVHGITLLDGQAFERDGTPALRPRLTLPKAQEPLFERIDVKLKRGSDRFDVTAYNAIGPSRRPSGPPGGGTATGGRVQRSGSGFAAFVVEIPNDTKAVTFSLEGTTIATVRCEVPFLRLLPDQAWKYEGTSRDQRIKTLTEAAATNAGPVSLAAVLKLGDYRAPAAAGKDPPPTPVVLDEALLRALRHPDALTRQAAWQALVDPRVPLPSTTAEFIASTGDTDSILAMLDNVDAALEVARAGGEAVPIETKRAGVHHPDVKRLPKAMRFLSDLPPSPIEPNVIAMLGASLRSQKAAVVERAVAIILADATQPTVALFADAPAPARKALVAHIGKVEDPDLRGGLLRVALAQPDRETVLALARVMKDLELTVVDEDDPVLTAPTRVQDALARQVLLRLLARADLEAVADSPALRKLSNALVAQESDPAVRRESVRLLVELVRGEPVHPARRDGAALRNNLSWSRRGVATLLADAAAHPDVQTHQPALVALLEAGHVDALRKALLKAEPATQRAVLKTLDGEEQLWKLDATPMLLAGLLDARDGGVQLAAMQWLRTIEQTRDASVRWRVHLAVQETLDAADLLKLTADRNGLVAAAAVDLLERIAVLSPKQAQSVRFAAKGRARNEAFAAIEKARATRPAGQFACLVFVDVAAPREGSSRPDVQASVPLVAGLVRMSAETDGAVRVESGDGLIALARPREAGNLARGTVKSSVTIRVASLLRSALRSTDAVEAKIAGRVNDAAIGADREADLEYVQFGQWACEVVLEDVRSLPPTPPDSATPLRLVSARIVLVPLESY